MSQRPLAFPLTLFVLGLLFMGALRRSSLHPGALTPLAGLATPGYGLLTVLMTIWLVRAYQGPAGVAGAAVNGLVFGAVTLAARWSIWPAALAHGINNSFGIWALYHGV